LCVGGSRAAGRTRPCVAASKARIAPPPPRPTPARGHTNTFNLISCLIKSFVCHLVARSGTAAAADTNWASFRRIAARPHRRRCCRRRRRTLSGSSRLVSAAAAAFGSQLGADVASGARPTGRLSNAKSTSPSRARKHTQTNQLFVCRSFLTIPFGSHRVGRQKAPAGRRKGRESGLWPGPVSSTGGDTPARPELLFRLAATPELGFDHDHADAAGDDDDDDDDDRPSETKWSLCVCDSSQLSQPKPIARANGHDGPARLSPPLFCHAAGTDAADSIGAAAPSAVGRP
jgi:hypothetical protein